MGPTSLRNSCPGQWGSRACQPIYFMFFSFPFEVALEHVSMATGGMGNGGYRVRAGFRDSVWWAEGVRRVQIPPTKMRCGHLLCAEHLAVSGGDFLFVESALALTLFVWRERARESLLLTEILALSGVGLERRVWVLSEMINQPVRYSSWHLITI